MLRTQSYFHSGKKNLKVTSRVKSKVWSSTSAIGTTVLIQVQAQISEPAEPPVLGACKMSSL